MAPAYKLSDVPRLPLSRLRREFAGLFVGRSENFTASRLMQAPPLFPRDLLEKYFGRDPRLVRAFEEQANSVQETQAGTVAATQSIEQATVVTLSPNAAFANEYVLRDGDGTRVLAPPGVLQIDVDESVARALNFAVEFEAPGVVRLGLPAEGTLVSDVAPAVMSQKNLNAPRLSGLTNAASDAAAACRGGGSRRGRLSQRGGTSRSPSLARQLFKRAAALRRVNSGLWAYSAHSAESSARRR